MRLTELIQNEGMRRMLNEELARLDQPCAICRQSIMTPIDRLRHESHAWNGYTYVPTGTQIPPSVMEGYRAYTERVQYINQPLRHAVLQNMPNAPMEDVLTRADSVPLCRCGAIYRVVGDPSFYCAAMLYQESGGDRCGACDTLIPTEAFTSDIPIRYQAPEMAEGDPLPPLEDLDEGLRCCGQTFETFSGEDPKTSYLAHRRQGAAHVMPADDDEIPLC